MAAKTVLAVDLGAESGRVMAVRFDGDSLALDELVRFPNAPVAVRGTLHWDVLRLWGDIQAGIARGSAIGPASIGVDTWGVDFGLLDAQGQLLGNPVHYRDRRTEGMMEQVFARVSRAEVFAATGIQFLPINTLYQLTSLALADAPQLGIAATFLTIPDLLNYWLTGARVAEFTNATTTQLLNPTTGTWAFELLERLGIPRRIFPEVVRPGTPIGSYGAIPVIAPATHDTGSAVAAVPMDPGSAAYISSGTWSLVGLEVPEPILSQAALAANVTNEGGVGQTYRLLKNVMGLWILQQCRATWAAAGQSYSYAELVALAEAAPPLQSFFDPNDGRFLPPGDHPALIRAWCVEHGQPAPESHGAVVRSVLESLALAYRDVLETLDALAGRKTQTIHIVGGGVRNELLSQMTADATGLPVLAGPVEATVVGNALVQLIALGELADVREARQLVARMGDLRRYEPRETAAWDAAAREFNAKVQRREGA